MEVGLSTAKSETEVMIAKPKKTEDDDNCPIAFSENENCSDLSLEKGELKINKDEDQECDTKDNVVISALPPPEMFEIRNSPPLPSAGNKKLKKLMERNKQ